MITMVINHLLNGMILQVPPVRVGEKHVARSGFKVKVAHAARTPKPGNGSCLLVGWLGSFIQLSYTFTKKRLKTGNTCEFVLFFVGDGWVSLRRNLRIDPLSKGVFFSVTSAVDVVGISRQGGHGSILRHRHRRKLVEEYWLQKAVSEGGGLSRLVGFDTTLMASRNSKGNGYHLRCIQIIKPYIWIMGIICICIYIPYQIGERRISGCHQQYHVDLTISYLLLGLVLSRW